MSSKQVESPEIISKNDIKDKNPSLHRYILFLGQDMLFMKSRGEIRTPKHVGLSITCDKMTQSKIVLQMLNRHGHGISYSEVQREDTSWANKQLDDNYIVLPSNIKPGVFTHASADNWNRATDSITGKHLDIVDMVLFQDSTTSSGDFGELQIGDRTRRRSVDQRARRTSQIIRCPNLHGKNPGPIHLKGSVLIDWYVSCSSEHEASRQLDLAWVFLRLCPTKLLEIDFQRSEKQKMPGWTVFHALISTKVYFPTSIGYCQAIAAPPSDLNTVYTVLKRADSMFQRLGQSEVILTWDEALYSKAQIIKWRNPDEFKNVFNRLGGFHRATNFMRIIGTVMKDGGLEDILIESNVYGSAAEPKFWKGSHTIEGFELIKLFMKPCGD